jgi:putative spermidine/putrescine transport system permease protein
MAYVMQQKAFEPAAMAIVSFALTWIAMGIIQMVGRGRGAAQVGGGH